MKLVQEIDDEKSVLVTSDEDSDEDFATETKIETDVSESATVCQPYTAPRVAPGSCPRVSRVCGTDLAPSELETKQSELAEAFRKIGWLCYCCSHFEDTDCDTVAFDYYWESPKVFEPGCHRLLEAFGDDASRGHATLSKDNLTRMIDVARTTDFSIASLTSEDVIERLELIRDHIHTEHTVRRESEFVDCDPPTDFRVEKDTVMVQLRDL